MGIQRYKFWVVFDTDRNWPKEDDLCVPQPIYISSNGDWGTNYCYFYMEGDYEGDTGMRGECKYNYNSELALFFDDYRTATVSMARQYDGFGSRTDPIKLLGEELNEGTELYKASFSNNFAWKDETWIPEDHEFKDYPTDMFNGEVYKRREEVPNYLDFPMWEFVYWF
jgi:hypothetical protein